MAMDSDTQFQLFCLLCLAPLFALCVVAVVTAWVQPGPNPTPQEMKQRKQAEELMGELLWQEKFDRDDRHRRTKKF
jgi:hypothetical protein